MLADTSTEIVTIDADCIALASGAGLPETGSSSDELLLIAGLAAVGGVVVRLSGRRVRHT